jgi:hypothetical protein
MTTIGQADFDILAGIVPLVQMLERFGVRYAVTGSLAAVAHGVGRAVNDVDLVADLTPQQATELLAHIAAEYAADPRVVQHAVAERTSFPLIELARLLKVDIVLPRERALDYALERAHSTVLAHDLAPVPLVTAEDLLLFKLERAAARWPRRGLDWYDVQFLLKFRKDLDHAYLDRMAGDLGWTRGLTTARSAAEAEPLASDITLAFERTMLDGAWAQQYPPFVHVEGVRRDRIQGVAGERQRDRTRHPLTDERTLALDAFRWRYWECDDPASSERLVQLVAAHIGVELVDAP